MANGYDDHSLKATGVTEASSSDTAAMVAVRDKRYTKSGIGYRSQAQEATTLDPGQPGQTPPPIMFGADYAGGTAARKRGMVDEAKLPWQTAEEAASKPSRPRDTLPPFGLDEALPPWLKDRKGSEDEEKEALPPWLKKKGGDEEKESARPGMREDWMGGEEGEGPECESFPDEEDARDALSTLSQFVDGGTLKAIQNQIIKQYGDPADDQGVDVEPQAPGFMGESAVKEAPLNADKRNKLDNSDFALPGRKYPIDSPERARSALARVKQFGAPGDEKKVKAAVKKRYPDMKVD